MNKDELLSKKLTEVEEKQKHYLARRVESFDRERVENVAADYQGEPVADVIVHGASAAGIAVQESPMETDDDHPDGVICTLAECVQDTRPWAEVTEEQDRSKPDGLAGLETGLRPISEDLVIGKLKKHMEEKDKSINLLKKQIEGADKSRYYVCEVFSPPRICLAAREQGVRGG